MSNSPVQYIDTWPENETSGNIKWPGFEVQSYRVWSAASLNASAVIQEHLKLADRVRDVDEDFWPLALVKIPRHAPSQVAYNSSTSLPVAAAEYYREIENKLITMASIGVEERPVEEGAIQSALIVIDQLKRRQFAPPELSWHGGDAVVMLWAIAATTFALTVTDGELGYVVRRDRKTVATGDTMDIYNLRLEDLR